MCKAHADKPLFLFPDEQGWRHITYAGYLRAVRWIAAGLGTNGINPGDRVMLLADYGPEWCAAYMAIHMAGATVIPMDAQYTADEVRTLYRFTEPASVLCDVGHRNVLPPESERPVLIDTVFSAESLSSPSMGEGQGGSDFRPVPLPAGAPMSIIFTSGTTGDPKGVMLSEANFMSNVDFLREYRHLVSSRDIALSILPLHHVYGFTVTFLTPLLLGATTVFPRSLSGADIAAALSEQKVTILVAVPQVLALFHKKIYDTVAQSSFLVRDIFGTFRDITRLCRKFLRINPGRVLFRKIHAGFPTLRFLTSGGARLEPGILTGLRDVGFTVAEAYGLTETSPIACLNDPDRPVAGSVGKAMTGVEVRIESAGGDYDQGEICIRGPNVMMGYYKRPDATAHAIIDGWFHTGDLGTMDRYGNVYITGRKKEIIILPNGKNIYPEELEKLYCKSARIEEVCILAAGTAGREQLTAAVYPVMAHFKEKRSGSIHQEIKFDIENIALHLPSYQRVTRVELVDDALPRTRLGKLKRFRIQEIIDNRDASRGRTGEQRERTTGTPFTRFLMSELKLDFVPRPEHNIETDLGLDSLSKLELFASIEKRFSVEIGWEEAGGIISVKNLIDTVGDAADEGAAAGFSIVEEMKKAPAVPLADHVAVGFGLLGGLSRFIAHYIIHVFLKVFLRARIEGLEKLPGEGPCIIAGNHVSYFDALMLYGMLPYRVMRKMFSMSLPEIFDHFPLNLLRKPARIIMTGTHDTMIDSMRYSYRVLIMGQPMVIFPEGKRSMAGLVDRPKSGVFLLAAACNAPLVPVYLKGFSGLYSRSNPGFHFCRLEAEVLDPLPVGENIDSAMAAWYDIMREKNAEEFNL